MHITNHGVEIVSNLVVETDDRIVAEGTLQPSHGDGSITRGLLVLKEFRDRWIGRRLMVTLETPRRAGWANGMWT